MLKIAHVQYKSILKYFLNFSPLSQTSPQIDPCDVAPHFWVTFFLVDPYARYSEYKTNHA
jgi:hypothetical protein